MVGATEVPEISIDNNLHEGEGDNGPLKRNGYFEDRPHLDRPSSTRWSIIRRLASAQVAAPAPITIACLPIRVDAIAPPLRAPPAGEMPTPVEHIAWRRRKEPERLF